MKYFRFNIIVLLSLTFNCSCYALRPTFREENVCEGKPNPSFLPHPVNCRYFIYCVNGNVNTVECPAGLAFNPAKPPCDSASIVNCIDGTTAQPTTTTNQQPATTTPKITTTTTTPKPTTTTTTTPATTTTLSTTTTKTTIPEPITSTTTTTVIPTTVSTTTTTIAPTTTTIATTTTPITTTTTTVTTPLPSPPTTIITTTEQPTSSSTPTSISLPTTTQPSLPTTEWPIEPEIICPEQDDINKIVFISSNQNCSRYYLCYHNTPFPMTCAHNLEWNSKISKCDLPENAQCTITPMPNIFPICPRDEIGLYPHPLNCEWFLYCYHGHMTVQQCPFYFHWDVESESCKMKNIARCALNDDSRRWKNFKF